MGVKDEPAATVRCDRQCRGAIATANRSTHLNARNRRTVPDAQPSGRSRKLKMNAGSHRPASPASASYDIRSPISRAAHRASRWINPVLAPVGPITASTPFPPAL